MRKVGEMLAGGNEVPATACPNCGVKNDRAARTDTDAEGPKPGDITICMSCGHFMAFADDMSVRELTDKEMIDVAGDPRVVAISKAIAEFKRDPRVQAKLNEIRDRHLQ